jgi:hypothetical protein
VTAHELVLLAHSWLRWLVLALVAAVTARSLAGWRRGRAWTRADERLHVAQIAAADLQLALGLALYLLLSPLPRALLADVAEGMKQPALRFFGLEHPTAMLVALIALHIGRWRSKRARDGRARHRRTFVAGAVALLVIGAAIPWPGSRHGRPLLRTGGEAAGTDLARRRVSARLRLTRLQARDVPAAITPNGTCLVRPFQRAAVARSPSFLRTTTVRTASVPLASRACTVMMLLPGQMGTLASNGNRAVLAGAFR